MLSVSAGRKCLCSIVVAELLFGAAKSKRKEQTLVVLLPFIQRFKSYDFELNAALHFADIRERISPLKAVRLVLMIFRLPQSHVQTT